MTTDKPRVEYAFQKRRCTHCGRNMPAPRMKRDPNCIDTCEPAQHWICRSEISCAVAMRAQREAAS